MSVAINLPPIFRQLSGAAPGEGVSGDTVGECLDELVERFPELREKLFTGEGNIQNGISVFINGENAYPGELDKPVQSGDTLHIAQVVLGG